MPRGNAWASKNAEIAHLKAELERAKEKDMLRDFALKVGESIMTILATKPFIEWPNEAKAAFCFVRDRIPAVGDLYKQRLDEATRL